MGSTGSCVYSAHISSTVLGAHCSLLHATSLLVVSSPALSSSLKSPSVSSAVHTFAVAALSIHLWPASGDELAEPIPPRVAIDFTFLLAVVISGSVPELVHFGCL